MHACACVVPWEQRHLACVCSQFSGASWHLGDLAVSNSFTLGTRGSSGMCAHAWSHGNRAIFHVFCYQFSDASWHLGDPLASPTSSLATTLPPSPSRALLPFSA